MRFNIVWGEDLGLYAGHRGINDPRPSTIEADKYELFYSEGSNAYPMGVQFIKDNANIATLFTLPLAVTTIANIQE